MAQTNKGSIKKAKPSYFMSMLGVTLVLFVMGLIGWLIIIATGAGKHFKENVEVKLELRGDLNPKDSVALMQYLLAKPYAKEINFITKEEGKKIYIGDGNEDWDKLLDYNPLPNIITVKVKEEYVVADTLAAIQADLSKQTYVAEATYQKDLVNSINKNIRKWGLILLAIAILFAVVVIVLIDNTIRLAMFSNRFLIKTMQMVGATRWFIAKPMNIRAIINGCLSGLIAITAIWLFVQWAEDYEPALKAIHNNTMLSLLFIGLLVLGIVITVFSTHRSVIKYLRMKLDDLY